MRNKSTLDLLHHGVRLEMFPLLNRDQLDILFQGNVGHILKFQQNVHALQEELQSLLKSDVTCSRGNLRFGCTQETACKMEVDLGIHFLPDEEEIFTHVMELDVSAEYRTETRLLSGTLKTESEIAGPSNPHGSGDERIVSQGEYKGRAQSDCWRFPGSPINVLKEGAWSPTSTTINIVEAYLQRSLLGRAALHGFKHGKSLSQATRVKICNEVILAELDNNPEHSISSQRFHVLAVSISNLFEGELRSLYYTARVPAYGKQRAVPPKGMLYDKYHNILKYLRHNLFRGSKRQESNGAAGAEGQGDFACDPCLSDSIGWLEQHSSKSRVVLKPKWKATADYRINCLQKSVDPVAKCKIGGDRIQLYMKRFPCLSLGSGVDLLADDFDYLYGEKSKLLMDNWHLIARKVIHVSRRNEDTLPEETVKWLQLIPTLFKQPAIVAARRDGCREEKRKFWRPKVSESTDAFMLHVKTTAELESKVSHMRRKCEEVQKTLLPIPAVVGPTLCDILESYVIVGDLHFRVESPLVAFDRCFKIYHALHSHYPYQSSYSWLFVQRAIYNMTTQWDVNIPAVDAKVVAFQNIIV